MGEMNEVSASELLTSYEFSSEAAVRAKDALRSGAHLKAPPLSNSAASIRSMCYSRLRIVHLRGGRTFGDAECLASLAEMGERDVVLAFVDDREQTGWMYHLYLDPRRRAVAGCVGVNNFPEDDSSAGPPG
ncbi:hypothetical protein [Streptomyces sp. NBC_00102]|uniref:hypothetical protein n=1 Tax=Streptomyces sp. NBC_00102 TaxID=2975652 RepID=UPI00224D57D9|nr:hypothetical protein [Streptomyces sp. NBC_00102]MCX5397478.1 hypothetical protein [Streptomyces sp. NBC_00102]